MNPSTTPPKTYYEHIRQLGQPEEVFGDLGSSQFEQTAQLECLFKALIKQYHPDRFARQPDELAYVTEITKILNDMKQRASVKIKGGVYGDISAGTFQSVIRTTQRDYFVLKLLVEGSLADIYQGYYLDPKDKTQPKKEVVIKIIANRSMNALVEQEIFFYQSIEHFCFPKYVDNFFTSDRKRAIVLSYIPESYDLIELTRQYRQENQVSGIPQEHLVWMLDRFLSALGLLHQNRILHGNIQPDNLIIQPKIHNGMLVDFLHARISPSSDEVFAVVNPTYCAPEVLTRHFKPHPVSDIYALGICMIEMLGGHGNSLDDSIILHPFLRMFLQKMILTDPAKRASDAWALAAELKTLREQIFGSNRRFIPLDIGGSNGRR